MRLYSLLCRLPSVFIALACVTATALACPFCDAPSLTLTEQLSASQAAVLVQWAGGEEADREKSFSGTTSYEIIEVVEDESNKLEKGKTIKLDRYRASKKGDLFLLLGTLTDDRIEWSSPLEVTETSYNYMKQSPPQDAPTQKRLAYFMKFLEYPDALIATDAYSEFANAPYKDIVPLRNIMPREKLREWLKDPEGAPSRATRTGLFGLLLGLSGNEDDAEFMKAKILEESDTFRLGIDGVMSGYLVLTGDEGLDVIDEHKLRNREVPFSETFAAMQALRFMWTYGDNRISPDRLRQSMRILLDRPTLADLVIVDLARWDDWGVMDKLMELYDDEEYQVPSIKRAIVRFMLIAEKNNATAAEGEVADHVKQATANLEKLRKEDPKTVKSAERYFFD
ncbi:hypothetical protein [Thalassoglobus sp.]|uniref:hypothetical protein n=1 Tax=Thalassoglobus sp. TaxID=2795869 RepID=UPI003AA821C5